MNQRVTDSCSPAGCGESAASGPTARLRAAVVSQFGRPRGLWGKLAGGIMAWRPSNRRRNLWTVELLGIRPGDRVLEIGCGPGIALAACLSRVGPGQVVGVDHSSLMIERAGRRCAQAVRQGRLRLIHAPVEELPPFERSFDHAFTVNTIDFWPEPVVRLRQLRGLLRPGGKVAVTVQPRTRGAGERQARQVERRNLRRLQQAGFQDLESRSLPLEPPAVCVLGVAPSRSDAAVG